MSEQMERIDVLSQTPEELETMLAALGQPRFRAGQLFSWLHERRVVTFDEMTSLPAALRQALVANCEIAPVTESRRQEAKDGTVKFLFELGDGNKIESVLMRHDYGNSLCISTQVGCQMGCRFCASTIGGKRRDLRASEMLGQIYAAGRLTGERVDSVVMMGIGEPLDNFDQVERFLELVRHPKGLNLSHRHISLSTCGIIPMIDKLAERHYQLTLSVSLHAADNETRSRLMPINRTYPIEALLIACKRYFQTTGRRVSYEYSLISGVNDSPEQARRLLTLLKGQGCHVNLIPINPVAETGYRRGSKRDAEVFRDVLLAGGLSATIRRELGGEIDAACGQLRRKQAKEDTPTCG